MLELIPFLGLAFMLGIKHSYDADHIIAVSTFLRRSKSFLTSIRISTFWAIGHMLTATAITFLLFYFRDSFFKQWLNYFEIAVGIMLVVLGIWSIKDYFVVHKHVHEHDGSIHAHYHIHHVNTSRNHDHRHMFGIGIVHGLASNDELLILVTAALGVTTFGLMFLGIGIFSLGVIAGMLLFSLIFSYPLIKANSEGVFRYFSLGTGMVSAVYGIMLLMPFL